MSKSALFCMAFLFFISVNSGARDSATQYFPADGYIEVSILGERDHKKVNGLSMFCIRTTVGIESSCKWSRAEPFIRHLLGREDVQYVGMSLAPYSHKLILYFAETHPPKVPNCSNP